MRKKYLFTFLMTVVLAISLLVQASPASACTMGLTPGFWKNHQIIWNTSDLYIDDYYDTLFGLTSPVTGSDGTSVNLHIKLIDALNANGNKNGVNAFLRQSAAALLNSVYLEDYGNPKDVKAMVQAAFGEIVEPYYNNLALWRGPALGDMTAWKNYLENFNTMENAVFLSIPKSLSGGNWY